MELQAAFELPLLACCSQKGRTELVRGLRMIHLRRRTPVFECGDPVSGVYIVVSGVITLSLPLNGSAERVIGLVGPGRSFGLSALFSRKPHSVTAVAARDCLLVYLPKTKALRLMQEEPTFAHQVAVELSRTASQLISDIHMMTAPTALERTAMFLLEQMGESTGKQPMRLPASKGDIASKLNLTGSHFSRVLHGLASAGVISIQSSTVTVNKLDKLRRMVRRPVKRRRRG
jgi:CRP/FNR family transcriptional regulator, dissimilatory nitrate respiration regulator